MGGEPSEMLMASLKQRNAARQQARPEPAKATSGSQRGRKGKAGQGQPPRQPLNAQSAQVAAQWGRFVENIGEHDKQLQLQPVQKGTTPQTQHGGVVIKEVYQPTSLVDGKRAGGHGKVVQQVPLLSGQAAVKAAMEAPAVLIPDLVADLSLEDGSRVGGLKALPPIPQGMVGEARKGDEAGQEGRTVNGSVQHHEAPQQNGHTDGASLLDTAGLISTHPPLLSHETMTPSLAVQSTQPICPPPGLPIPVGVPQFELGAEGQQQRPRFPPGLPIPVDVPQPGFVLREAEVETMEEEAKQNGTGAGGEDGGKEEAWLIQF